MPETFKIIIASMVVGVPLIALLIKVFSQHRIKMKELEIEALRVQKVNLEAEVRYATEGLVERMEVLEAIVTEKSYDLNERITRIK